MDAINTIMDAISTNNAMWVLIGGGIGSFIGAVITFWVAEGMGFRNGTIKMQRHYEQMSAQKLGIDDSEEISAPEEIMDAEFNEQRGKTRGKTRAMSDV